MAQKKLQCVCGDSASKPWAVVNQISIVECRCGIRRVEFVDPDKYTALYTSGKYHTEGSEDLPHDPNAADLHRAAHRQRFADDIDVAKKRLLKLTKYVPVGQTLIDIGCANGAFMDVALSVFDECYGVDLSNDAVPDAMKDRVRVGDLRFVGFQRRSADVITFNDSFEHFIDPLSALKAARGILKRDGMLVIEIPDMGSKDAIEQGARFKHVKPHEHLWYFTATQLRSLLEREGFNVLDMQVPVPGKVAVYASPAVTVEDVTVYGPPGIGDILWTLHKLPDIAMREYPARIKYVVCVDGEVKLATRARDLLGLCKHIDSYDFQVLPLPPDDGCPDPSYPVYNLIANAWLQPRGELLEKWRPELSNCFDDAGITVPQAACDQAIWRTKAERYAAVYMSSLVWNRCAAQPQWTAKHWADLCIRLNDANIKPVILGAEWDLEFSRSVAAEIVSMGRDPNKVWINTAGKTPLALAMAYMQQAEITIGIAAGLPIIAGYMGWPTIIFWPRGGTSSTELQWKQEFETNWLPPHIRSSGVYHPIAIGTFTPSDVIEKVKGNMSACG